MLSRMKPGQIVHKEKILSSCQWTDSAISQHVKTALLNRITGGRMIDKYILNGKTPIPISNLMEWADWVEKSDRTVRKTTIENVLISTVFLGIDHSANGAIPILFETMVFDGPMDQEMERYATWDEAEAGHAKMVERVKRKLVK